MGGVGLADVAFAAERTPGRSSQLDHPTRHTLPGRAGFKFLSGRALFEFSDLEDFRPAVRADSLDSRATVLHRHLFGVFDLDLLTLFDAVTLRHEGALLSIAATRQISPCERGGLRRM